MIIRSHSFALEDVFALYLTEFKSGFFVDIGGGHPHLGSNSATLEKFGWSGICIDRAKHDEWDDKRSTQCHQADATTLDYGTLFRQAGLTHVIDFLSIDVDDSCFEVLESMPLDRITFRIVAIEHDAYRTSALRGPERELLRDQGYDLVCADVLHEPGKPFEDWWVKHGEFDSSLINKIRSDGEIDTAIIRKFGHRNRLERPFGFYGDYPRVDIA